MQNPLKYMHKKKINITLTTFIITRFEYVLCRQVCSESDSRELPDAFP